MRKEIQMNAINRRFVSLALALNLLFLPLTRLFASVQSVFATKTGAQESILKKLKKAPLILRHSADNAFTLVAHTSHASHASHVSGSSNPAPAPSAAQSTPDWTTSQNSLYSAVILGIDASGVSSNNKIQVLDKLIADLNKAGKYGTITRQDLVARMDQLGVTVPANTSLIKRLALASLLKATRLITATFQVTGGEYTLELSYYDVDTGDKVASSTRVYASLQEMLQPRVNLGQDN
jgi:hypothetical protein